MLTAQTEEEATLWANLISKQASQANVEQRDAAVISAAEIETRQEEERRGLKKLSGQWMTKKGLLPEDDRRRFLLLQGETIQCFTDEPRRTQRLKPESVLTLSKCTKSVADNRSFTVATPNRSWHLGTDQHEVAVEWAEHITRLCADLEEAGATETEDRDRTKSISIGMVSGETETDQAPGPFTGSWLHGVSSEGRCGRRYFHVNDPRDFIQYYDGLDESGNPVDLEGSIAIDSSISFFKDELQLTIVSPFIHEFVCLLICM